MKKIVLATTVLMVLACFCTTVFAGKFKVLRVVDGDTIDIDFNGHKERVRLLCVNTPESVHPNRARNTPLGSSASLYTKKILAGKNVDLKFEGNRRGRYKRLLAYVFVNNRNFNLDLVEKGLSPYYTRYGASKAYDLAFKRAEQRAKVQQLNIWNHETGKTTRSPALTAALDISLFRGNKGSRIFHKPGCRYFNCSQCTMTFHTRDGAIGAGFQPCRICRP